MPQVTSQRLQVVYWPIEKLIPFFCDSYAIIVRSAPQSRSSIRSLTMTISGALFASAGLVG